MKARTFFCMHIILFLVACNTGEKNDKHIPDETKEIQSLNYYGDKIGEENIAQPQSVFFALETTDSLNTKLEGVILSTCPVKGCWMDVKLSNGEQIKVRFKDYGFFVPKKGAEGKTTIIEGIAYRDTLSVDAQRHYAEDAGKYSTEINAITEPKATLAFEASGVIIKD